MADTNVSRVRRNDRYAENKAAFDDVIGDPFGVPDPVDGQYSKFKQRSSIRVANNDFDSGHATPNAARPSPLDFFCDVERAVEDALGEDRDQAVRFMETYIWQSSDNAFTPKERADIEQRVGTVLLKRKISPVTMYFKVIRRSVGTTKRAKEHAASIRNAAVTNR